MPDAAKRRAGIHFSGEPRLMARGGFVYILANRRRGTLYVGVTSDLVRRIYQHRAGETGGFTTRYRLSRLVYLERHDEIADAIVREKRLKRWRRQWKIELIEQENAGWLDLWPSIVGVSDVDPG